MATTFRIRPQKLIDRELFIEALLLAQRTRALKDYVYLGMGGPSLEDHKLIHKRLGVSKLISIEKNPTIFRRQKFNLPSDSIKPVHITSQDAIAKLDEVLRKGRANVNANRIIWLDYVSATKQHVQIREFGEVVARSRNMDFIKVTLNANPEAFYRRAEKETAETGRSVQFDRIKKKLGDFIDTDITADDMMLDRFPTVLGKALIKEADKRLDGVDLRFIPLTFTRYTDVNHQMLSLTGVVIHVPQVEQFLDEAGFLHWEFWCESGMKCLHIEVSDLTVRERIEIERTAYASRSTKSFAERTRVFIEENKGDNENVVEQYRRFCRFFPHFEKVIL